jgi:hypothetical protein
MGLITAGGQVSIARIQIAWAFCYLALLLASPARPQGSSPGAIDLPLAGFIVFIIILTVSTIGLVLERRLERMSAPLRAWLAATNLIVPNAGVPGDIGEQSPTGPAPRWLATTASFVAFLARAHRRLMDFLARARRTGMSDIAVAQLAIGIAVVPAYVTARNLPLEGWRLVLIAALSEMVYLAFLGARIINLAELEDLARESRDLEQRLSKKQSAKDAGTLKIAHQALQARAAALWQQLSPTFDSPLSPPNTSAEANKSTVAQSPGSDT